MRSHSIGRTLIQIGSSTNKSIASRYIQRSFVLSNLNKTLFRSYKDQSNQGCSKKRPTTRKKSNRNNHTSIEDEPFPLSGMRHRHKPILPKIRNEIITTVVTSGRNRLIEEYQENMNLQNYDFNRHNRLLTAVGRSKKSISNSKYFYNIETDREQKKPLGSIKREIKCSEDIKKSLTKCTLGNTHKDNKKYIKVLIGI